MIRALLAAILILAAVVVWQRGSMAIASRRADAAETARETAESARDTAVLSAAQLQRNLDAERAGTAAANRLAANYEKEKADAQAASDRIVADLRAGTVRLHQRWQAAIATGELSAAAAAAAQPDGGAADRIQSAGRAIGAAAQCDAQVKGLQQYALLCSVEAGQ